VYVMTKGLKERLEKAIRSLLVARWGRNECDDLDSMLVDWDGHYSREIRSIVTRHVESCDVCKHRRSALVAWETLAPSMPITLAPAATKVAVLAAIGISPALATRQRVKVRKPVHQARRRRIKSSTAVVLGSAATILLAMAVIAAPQIFIGGDSSAPTEVAGITESAALPDVLLPVATTTIPGAASTSTSTSNAPTSSASAAPSSTTTAAHVVNLPGATVSTIPSAGAGPTTVPSTTVPSTTVPSTTAVPSTTVPSTTAVPIGARIGVATTSIQFGSAGVSSIVVVNNSGDRTMSFNASVLVPNGNTAGLLFTVTPSSGRVRPVAPNRSAGVEGDHAAQLQIVSTGGNAFVPMSISIEHPPALVSSFVTPATVFDNVGACAGNLARTTTAVSVAVSDESGVRSVVAAWGTSSTLALTQLTTNPGEWVGRVGPWPPLPANSSQPTSMTIVVTDARGNSSRFDFGVQLVACV